MRYPTPYSFQVSYTVPVTVLEGLWVALIYDAFSIPRLPFPGRRDDEYDRHGDQRNEEERDDDAGDPTGSSVVLGGRGMGHVMA